MLTSNGTDIGLQLHKITSDRLSFICATAGVARFSFPPKLKLCENVPTQMTQLFSLFFRENFRLPLKW